MRVNGREMRESTVKDKFSMMRVIRPETLPMPNDERTRGYGRLRIRLAALALAGALAAGCAQLRDIFAPAVPGIPGEWAALIEDVQAYERRIGFVATSNFYDLSEGQAPHTFCGVASRLALPYSYEDPAIRWSESMTEAECLALGRDADAYFGTVEALGEVETPVTPAMIDSRIDRFLYLVIHEDCHDQFELPYGVEEALCNLITYKAMAEFSEQHYGPHARESRAVQRYAEAESRTTRATISYYSQLAALYARHERGELSVEGLMQARAAILRRAERSLEWKRGELNNVALATDMTYSRHYPLHERVHDALGRDLARTVAFFKEVDRLKPAPAAVMKRRRIASQSGVEFIRAYEAAVVETIQRELQAATGDGSR